MSGGFELRKRKGLKAPPLFTERSKASTAFIGPGTAVIYTEGQIDLATAATRPVGIFQGLIPPASSLRFGSATSTANNEEAECMSTDGGGVFETSLAGEGLEVSNELCSNNGTTTTAKFTDANAAAAFDGGVIFFHDTKTHHTITNDAEAGGEHTVTFTPARTAAPTTATRVSVLPKGPGYYGIKLSAVSAHRGVDPTVAGMSGGKGQIEYVDLDKSVIGVSWPRID